MPTSYTTIFHWLVCDAMLHRCLNGLHSQLTMCRVSNQYWWLSPISSFLLFSGVIVQNTFDFTVAIDAIVIEYWLCLHPKYLKIRWKWQLKEITPHKIWWKINKNAWASYRYIFRCYTFILFKNIEKTTKGFTGTLAFCNVIKHHKTTQKNYTIANIIPHM